MSRLIDGYTITKVMVYYDFPRMFIGHPDEAPERLMLGLWEDELESPAGKVVGDVYFLMPIASEAEVVTRIEEFDEPTHNDYLRLSADGTMQWVEVRYGKGSTITEKSTEEALESIRNLLYE